MKPSEKVEQPTEKDLDEERFILRGDPEEALRRLLEAKPHDPEAEDADQD